jgi:hypothetical protein
MENCDSLNEESYLDLFHKDVPKCLAVIIFTFGMFGNIFSVLIFNQDKMRKNSTYIYLSLLTVVDMGVLALGLGDVILISHAQIVIRNYSIAVCRLHTFLTYTFTHLSSFILVSVSIDRVIATNAINYAKVYCKPKMAYKVFVFNCVLAVAINFHYLIFLGYDNQVNCSNLSMVNS